LQPPIWVVGEVRPGGPANQLQQGDEVVSVRGYAPGWLGPAYRLIGLYPGQSYALTVRRDARTLSLRLHMGLDPASHAVDGLATLFIAGLLFLAGMWIRLGGPRDLTAQLGSATFLLGGIAMVGPVLLIYPGWSISTAWLTVTLARIPRPFELVLGWDFFSRFPHPVLEGLAIRILRRVFYGAGVVLWTAINLPILGQILHAPYPPAWDALQWLGRDGPFETTAEAAFEAVISAAVCYVLVRNYRLLVDRDSRRRIRWAAASFGLGAVAVLSLRLLQLAASMTGVAALDTASRVADTVTTFAIGLIPVTLAYAVVKHRVLGIRLVIRRGLQYLLAKNVLRLILLAPALIVLLQIVREPDRSVSDLIFRSSWRFYLLVMGTAICSLRYRRELSWWLDRRFFRRALREEETWVMLTESIRTASSEDEIASAVAHQIEVALPVEGIHVFFRTVSGGRLRSAFPRAGAHEQAVEQPFERDKAEALANNSVFATPLPDQPLADETGYPDERQSLVVPLLGTDGEAVGAIVLGPKKSEQPYTAKERELLQATAAHVVMACEVLRLKRSVHQESKQRIAVLGRLERENIQLLNECLECGECYSASQKDCPIDGSALQLTLPVERVIAGRYWLNRRIGAGGMGVVYEALDLRQDKLVAVKIMTGELFGNQNALVRFKREAHAVASLRHPNIVGMQDFGELPAGGAFLAMDLVRGLSWRKHLQVAQPLSPERVAGWVEELCAGVGAAHRSGIVHRDLKPENVMISEHADVEAAMVLDFGLAKLHSGFEFDGGKVSVSGMVLGTQSYMSPEQRAGQSAGSMTDIYSIAVMTLETIARLGPPKTGATDDWAKQALRRIVPADSELAALFSSALANDPAARIQGVCELGSRLSAAIRSEKPIAPSISKSDDAETLSWNGKP